jgi:hypothetical protein
MQMLSVGECGYGNTRYTRVNISPQDLNTRLNHIKFNSNTKWLSILYYNTMDRGSKDTTIFKSENIMIQLGYNAFPLHENILLS